MGHLVWKPALIYPPLNWRIDMAVFSSRQACFVIAHSLGDLMRRIFITIGYILWVYIVEENLNLNVKRLLSDDRSGRQLINRSLTSSTSPLTSTTAPTSPSQSSTPRYSTSIVRVTTHRRHQQTAVTPFIGQSIIRPSHPSPIPKSTRRKRIPLHSTLRTDYNC